jgi:FAD/FMN-containing dehydrogenase
MWHGKRILVRDRAAASSAAGLPAMEANFPSTAVETLRGQIQGKVVLAGDDNYHLARQGFVVNYQAFPQIVVYCAVASDVAAALEFARCWKLSPVCRSGGHNAAGYSVNNDIIIDVSQMSYVVVDPERKRATVGAGTTFGRLNATLDAFRLHVPGGDCPDVAVAGYMQGGGYGFTSQLYGMNCDCVIEALVMLADGSIVVASEQVNPDLFWALRGGTGNNFGVLLQVTYRLFDPGPLWGFGINWRVGRRGEEAAQVAAALETLQNNFTGADVPKGLGHQSSLNFIGDDPYLYVRGIYEGAPKVGRKVIAPLLKIAGANFDIDKVGSYAELSTYLGSHPDVPQIAPHTRTQADSRYTERPLCRAEWAQIVELFVRSPNQANFIGLEGYGGAIRAVKPTAMAFRHRLALFHVFSWIFWQNEAEEAASLAFLEEFRRVLTPLSNGHAYQNYPNRKNPDYRCMYWGENFPRLLAIKEKYDPHTLFCFGQTVSPPPAGSRAFQTVPAPGQPSTSASRSEC